ncbi:unnamed protein product, partial [Oppiella nova]
RKLANSTSPTLEITRNGDEFVFKTVSTVKTSTMTFTLGKEFEEERLDGKKVKSVITVEGNKLIQTQKDGDKEVTYVREFSGDTLTAVSEQTSRSPALPTSEDTLQTRYLFDKK